MHTVWKGSKTAVKQCLRRVFIGWRASWGILERVFVFNFINKLWLEIRWLWMESWPVLVKLPGQATKLWCEEVCWHL